MAKSRWRAAIRSAPNLPAGPASRAQLQPKRKQSRQALAAAAASAADVNSSMQVPMRFLDQPPLFLFFTGKGGVGKTSLAWATAVCLADKGKRVLLVSTDPASNVGQVFGVTVGNVLTPIEAVPGLAAFEIDPEAAAQQYRNRIVGPVRGVLPDAVVRSIEEQLSGACTTEIAAFDEFNALLTDPALVRHS